MNVVTTGASRRSARTRSSSQAPERRTPPPAQTTGRSAAASSAAASATSAAGGSGSAAGLASSSPTGVDWASPVRKSTGISTNTGPVGGVSARRQASASAPGISSGDPGLRAHFTIGANDASWSGSSCRYPRPRPSRSFGICEAIATTGTWELAASISVASEISAPGPVERTSGAGRPLTRA